MMLEPAASVVPRITADGFSLRCSDVIADDVEEWKHQGYLPSEQPEDGYSVFIFNGEPDAKGKDSAASHIFVDAEPEEDSDSEPRPLCFTKGELVKPCDWKCFKVETPKDDPSRGRNFFIFDTNQEVFVEMWLEHACDRNFRDHTGLILKLAQIDFGVHNSENENNHRGYFISRLEVTASPTDKWRRMVDVVKVEPSDDSHDETFSVQRTSALNVSIGLHPKSLGAAYTKSRATTHNEIRRHGWVAEKDLSTHAVTWIWGLNYWQDGQPYHLKTPSKVKWPGVFGPLPGLPINPRHTQFNKSGAQAEWLVSNEGFEGTVDIQWDITVKVHTALIRKTVFGKHSKDCAEHFIDKVSPQYLTSKIILTTSEHGTPSGPSSIQGAMDE